MSSRESDWLIVLGVWESQAQGEAASNQRIFQGQHEPHAMEVGAFIQ